MCLHKLRTTTDQFMDNDISKTRNCPHISYVLLHNYLLFITYFGWNLFEQLLCTITNSVQDVSSYHMYFCT